MPINPIEPKGAGSALPPDPPDPEAWQKPVSTEVEKITEMIESGLTGNAPAITSNTFPALFRPPSTAEVTPVRPFLNERNLTAVTGMSLETVTVISDGEGWALVDNRRRPYTSSAFLYNDDHEQVGISLAGKLRARWDYEVNNGYLIELSEGKPYRLLGQIIAMLGTDGLIVTTYLQTEITLENGRQYEIGRDGCLVDPAPIPLYLTRSFFNNPLSYYNAATGRLTFPAMRKHPAITIDLGIVGLPPPLVTVTTTTTKFQITIRWGDDRGEHPHLIDIQGQRGRVTSPESLSLNLWRTTATGLNYQYSRRISTTADDLAKVINIYTRQQREVALTRMAKNAATHPTPGITRYAHLGTDYEQAGAPQRIDSWSDLEGLIVAAIRQAPAGQALEFEIEQRFVDALEPLADFLERVAGLAVEKNPITLVVHGHPIDPPKVYHFFNDNGMTDSTTKPDGAVHKFWNHEIIAGQITLHLEANLNSALLLRAYFEVHTANPQTPLALFLAEVIDAYNRHAADEVLPLIPDDQRTFIYPWLETITHEFRDAATATATRQGIIIPPGALHRDPITEIRRAHPASTDPHHQVVFIDGGGAMGLALAAHIRRRMNRGPLPLDIWMVGVDDYLPGIWRLARTGYSASFKSPINPEGVLPLLVLPSRLLHSTLQARRPRAVFFTQKTERLASTKADPALAAELADINPAMPNPAKSLLRGVLIPYGAIRQSWLDREMPNLAAHEIVIGGYARAEDVLEGSEYIFLVVAGEDPEAIEQIRYLLGDHNIEYIVGKEMAEVIQAAGALKNITTYYSGRRIMEQVLAQDGFPSSYDLQTFISDEVAATIELIEETIARITRFHGMNTNALSLPRGVIQDVIKCLDLNQTQLAEIRRRFESAIISVNLGELDSLLDDITNEKVKLGGATRNPRDGGTDELIFWAYYALRLANALQNKSFLRQNELMEELRIEGKARRHNDDHLTQDILALAGKIKGKGLPETMTFEEFYQARYPGRWKGAQRQEGRSGIDPLTEFEDEHEELTLLGTITMAAHAYARNNQRVSRPEHQRRSLNAGDNSVWGLPTVVVDGFRDRVRLLNGALLRRSDQGEAGVRQVIRVGLTYLTLTRILNPETINNGAYSLVNQRLLGIRAQMDRLREVLRRNHITEERAESFIDTTERALTEVQNIFRDEVENTTALLGRLRHIAKGLDAAEQALLTGTVPYRYTPPQVEGVPALRITKPTPMRLAPTIPATPHVLGLTSGVEHFLNVSTPQEVHTSRTNKLRHRRYSHSLDIRHAYIRRVSFHAIHPLTIPVTGFGVTSSLATTSLESFIVAL